MTDIVTLASSSQASITEKRSEFIASVAPVKTEEEACAFIAQVKKRHSAARHNCYAYILRSGTIKRYSDDGEPQGSAGVPMLDVMEKSGLVDAVVVVTRYFGGILLGTGGLVRAYTAATKLAVEKAGVAVWREHTLVEVTCDYNDYGRVMREAAKCSAHPESSEYAETVCVRFSLPPEDVGAMTDKVAEVTAGRAALRIVGTKACRIK